MPFWSKKEKAPPPQPIAYLDVLRAPDAGFLIQLRQASSDAPAAAEEPQQMPDSEMVSHEQQYEQQPESNGYADQDGAAPDLPPHGGSEMGMSQPPQQHPHSSGTSSRSADFYSTTIHRKKLKKDAAGVYHGAPGTGTLLADVAGQKIVWKCGETPQTVKRRQLVFRKSVMGQRNSFRFEQTEIYMFRKSKTSPSTVMVVPQRKSPKSTHPIIVFDVKPGEKDRLAEIRLYEPETEIDTLLEPAGSRGHNIIIPDSELQPTPLLDTAIMAWFTYRSFHTGGSLVNSLEFKAE